MSFGEEYRDFICYAVNDSSEMEELEVELENISELFSSEGVYLFVRYDIRRIFIWKGPRSPVRKRFISSRLASKLQEESSKVGMHLKIVSVDAGDEPVEFLNACNVESYVVSEDERPEDMYYVRNEERRKMEEQELLAKKNAKEEKKEYWSPVLEEQKRLEQMQEAKKKAVSTAKEIASSIEDPKPKKAIPRKKVPSKSYASSYSRSGTQGRQMSKGEEKAVLDLILGQDIPDGKNRLNIIIGTSLYGPKRMISSLFGKEVEEIHWDKMSSIPDGKIEIDTNQIRVYAKDNEIEGIEILGMKTGSSAKPEKKKRELKEIPKGE